VKWQQKVALTMSLRLTIFLIIATIVRVSGIRYHGETDTVWESYWNIISAEIGVIMAAATAFRSFFVARSREQVNQALDEQLH
jgi:hypothetical protein